MTATQQPHTHRPSWARTAARRTLRMIRYVDAEIALAYQAMARPGRAPQPRPMIAPAVGYGAPAGQQPLTAAKGEGAERAA